MDMSTSPESPEFRVQAIKTRRMEIFATLAEWRRQFIVDGISRSLADRVTLEAEDAKLALEARQIGDRAMIAQVERRARLNRSLLAKLLEVLNEHDCGHLLTEAQQRVDAAEAGEERATA